MSNFPPEISEGKFGEYEKESVVYIKLTVGVCCVGCQLVEV